MGYHRTNQTKKRNLKKSMTGLEVESHLIDRRGKLSHAASHIISETLKRHPSLPIVPECSQSLIEFGCYPGTYTYNPAIHLVSSIEKAIAIARSEGIFLYPFGTYPGKGEVKFSTKSRYFLQELIFGSDRFALATKVAGFHHHHILPKGVFDSRSKQLVVLADSKLKQSLLSCYNFEIAIDPILALFTQSSPFVDCTYLAKDSRMLLYRGGKKLDYPSGLYADLQQFGGLPPYKQTATDLVSSLHARWKTWKKMIRKVAPQLSLKDIYPYPLDISWHPVKINKKGTLEQRGMDMTYLSIVISVSVLLKFCLNHIQKKFIEVVPSDIGINKAFTERNGVLYIPPHTYVRGRLQKASAYEGFDNDELYRYARRFYAYARSLTPKYYHPLLKTLDTMLRARESTSDQILAYAAQKGHIHGIQIDRIAAQDIALEFSHRFEEDLKETKKLLLKIKEKAQG